ncbi:hypothetical protein D3C83_10450 [compost metagenome]
MRAALVLGQGQARRIPAVGPLAGSGIDRQAQIVAELGTRTALRLILVEEARPVAVQRALRRRRTRRDEQEATRKKQKES